MDVAGAARDNHGDDSSEDEMPQRIYPYSPSTTATAPAGQSTASILGPAPTAGDDEPASPPYESARSSIFAPTITLDRPATPPSPAPPPSSLTHMLGASAHSLGSGQSSRTAFMDSTSTLIGGGTVTAATKAGDDPSHPYNDSPPGRHSTPGTLTRLLAMSTSMASPASSRNTSYADGNPNLTRQMDADDATGLHHHLYNKGLLEGKHSDIAVLAFGHRYNLHRLILDRASFFTTALSGPWIESRAKEMALYPEEVDPTITQQAFELALKRLYGCDIKHEEDAEAVGLFATGCWLEMPDLVDSSIESILCQMDPSTLAPLIRLVTNNYYGRAGDRILASAKAMLCRDGWDMPVRYWDEVPGEVVREIVGGDGLYVAGEWERWCLAKRLLDRRLKMRAVRYGLATKSGTSQPPEVLRRQSSRYGHARAESTSPDSSEDVWTAIYTDPDIEPILVLMDHGIHYVHLDFERLQFIRQAKDVLGLSVLPEHVIANALWQQMELRQKVVNAREDDLELGLSKAAEVQPPEMAQRPSTARSETSTKGKQREDTVAQDDDDSIDAAEERYLTPRKFWIPSADCNIIMGGNAEPVITTNATSNFLRLSSELPAGVDATDVLWASNFAGPSPSRIADRNRIGRRASTGPASEDGVSQPKPVAYSNIPPFRFAAEFSNPKSLKEKKRVYSRTVFYAGSHWNIYIQKVRSQKNPQLGVYLHRAKERDTEDADLGGAKLLGTVDERIGLPEREMLLRSNDGRRAMGRPSVPARHGENREDDGSMAAYRRTVYGETSNLATSFTAFESGSSSGTDDDGTNVPLPPPAHGVPGFLDEPTPGLSSGPSLTHFPRPSTARPHPHPYLYTYTHNPRTPTLPPYTDTRPTIKTYFKIYSPSKGGRLLSVYESAPDKFDYSQSWGWKSSTLMLDEGFSGEAGEGTDGPGVGDGLTAADMEREGQRRRRREGALRFMVVIGNL